MRTQGCPVQELQGCAVVGEGSMPLTGCSACLIEECTEASLVHEGVDTPVLTKRHLLPGLWSSSSNGGRYGSNSGGRYGSRFLGHMVSRF